MIMSCMYICICNAVTEHQVRECAREGAKTIDELTLMLGVGAGCGRCRECASELLRKACRGAACNGVPDSEAILTTAT
jgi:bacterioferritin-associated ferredoxin